MFKSSENYRVICTHIFEVLLLKLLIKVNIAKILISWGLDFNRTDGDYPKGFVFTT